MDSSNILDLYSKTQNIFLLFQFKGVLSQDVLNVLTELLDMKMSYDKKLKRLFAVFVELAQNIMHYSAEREIVDGKEIGVGIIVFSEKNNMYKITSGNLISHNEESKFIKKIELVNSYSNSEELKQVYKNTRRTNPLSGGSGAGLGLIDMRRKSGNKIDYAIEKVDDKHSFLTVTVNILKEKINE